MNYYRLFFGDCIGHAYVFTGDIRKYLKSLKRKPKKIASRNCPICKYQFTIQKIKIENW